ncbi:4-coumarate--CoA ligase 1 [Ceratina calcarata]|uniref:Luciferin 4-monooxygenase n=1 Tax=Ceratina calcarata TaxID=156304 RepID=A0AAJ7JDQ9_9HYME|nr:4-coumarate--CoA ligase 1 [Ceratina calcarata]XP_017890363.1 4-coumarate--CoA ligase 1 [Ceratina calcarata]XP_017890364.1 4-coumarate--CoA ligase 1 [Ceratina calcarata]
MTTVRQILRCARRIGQIQEGGAKLLNRSVRCASTQARQKITEDENGKKVFLSPYGDFTPSDLLVQEYIWKDLANHANKIALECAVTGRKYTYSETRDASNYIARSLINMGLRKGDVIALIAPNYPETVLAFLGVLEANLVVTTVNPAYTPDEVKRQIQNSGAKAIITVAEIARSILEATRGTLPPGVPFVVIEDGTGPIPEATIPFKDLIARGKSLPPVTSYQTTSQDLAILPYSSGTTGLPKGVMLTHKNLVANMEMSEKTAGEKMWQSATSDFQEIIPVILPFFHIFGMNVVTLPRLAHGTKLITLPRFIPELFIKLLMKEQVTGMFVVPPILLFFNSSPYVKKELLSNVHHIISGAAPMSKTDAERFYNKFETDPSKLKITQGYGLTETSPVVCLEMDGVKTGSIGKNIAGCELRLVDPATNEDVSGPGQTGEIWVRGPHVMKGYLNNEAATRETIVENSWLKTGDIAYFDEEFDFFVTDRLKELIKVKGFQVAPAELEALLRTHPDVQEAAVIGIPDERSGEVPKAFILLKKNAKSSAEDIKNFIKGKVSDYKELQGGVVFVDNIPKNASGKIVRQQLKNECK